MCRHAVSSHATASRLCRLAIAIVIVILASGPAAAQVAKAANDPLSRLAFRNDELAPAQALAPLADSQSAVPSALRGGWQTFRGRAKTEWRAAVDSRTGQVAMAEGGGIAWIPGRGNSLTQAGVTPSGRGADREPTLATLEAIARRELEGLAPILGVAGKDLVLNQGRSGHPADYLWLVDFDEVREGLAVEGAHVVFRVNNGNLIQFGSENLPSPGAKVPPTTIDRAQARAAVAKYVGGLAAGDTLLDAGSLHLLPVNVGGPQDARGAAPGQGRGLVKVWQLTFRRPGVMGTWRARVDASSGKLLEFVDVNAYAAQVTGGVYPFSPAIGPEATRAMPFADAGGGTANSAGLYNFTTPTSTTLNGPYVRISDSCGAISQPSDGVGNVTLGVSGGNDCATPGHGGAGDTHASRTQFYHVNRIKEVGRGWLPANAWLGQKLTVNVDLNMTCNAYWNGSTLNFFKSGGGCGNTGEIAAVSLHEYGHGLDQNDGTPLENTSEAYADVTAVIALHNSCIGPGFRTGNCGGYGDACTACTGVRDVDFAQHASNAPATVSNFTQVHCGSGGGPCGREVHCESYVASEAIWDFANRDLPNPGTGSAWTTLDRLWYLSRSSSTTGFSCTTGGTFTSDGCNIGSWWKTMRAVDDDDGDLTNGTPHGGELFAAFNRHGIACPTDPGASVTFAGCAPPPVPTLGLAAGDNSVAVTVTGTGVFAVYRNEVGCNAGFTKIADDFAGGTLVDTNVANGTTYFYQAVAQPNGNEACASVPTTCQSVTPSLAPQIQVPSGADLGDTCVGASRTGTVDVCNTGKSDLIVATLTSSNPEVSATVPSGGYPVTIGPAFCFPFQVAFHPTATGPQSATLTIPSNDPATPDAHVQITGNGTQPDIRVTGSTDFGVASAWQPAEKTVSVCNTGSCPLAVTSAMAACTDFTLVNDPFPATVAPGSCLNLVVRFTPVLPGAKSCTLTIASDAPGTPTVSRILTARTPPFLSLHAGLADPHGALHLVAKQGSSFHLDYVYPWKPQWAWDVRLGSSRFDGRAGHPDTDVATLSADAKFTVNPASPVRVFLNGGLGLYHFNPGDFAGGGNLGLGLNVPLGHRFALELTYNYDWAFTASPSLDFSQVQLGLLVSF
ncbi:MAG TPA: choice-of-anchor D domain-containing protein [Thermoanaerobaculia bacterium]|nr:choice-of-anchor D domain-containing protein [Thermoanaerobaculia bacterium]